MTDGNGNTLKYRVEQLEKRQERIDGKLDQIMTNHLPHINEEIISLKTQIRVASAINVGVILAAILLSKYLG